MSMKAIAGVGKVDVDLNTGLVTIALNSGNAATMKQFNAAVEKNGFTHKDAKVVAPSGGSDPRLLADVCLHSAEGCRIDPCCPIEGPVEIRNRQQRHSDQHGQGHYVESMNRFAFIPKQARRRDHDDRSEKENTPQQRRQVTAVIFHPSFATGLQRSERADNVSARCL